MKNAVRYFAYGSNLDREKLLFTVGSSLGNSLTATLNGHEVVFNKRSIKWVVAANIIENSNAACEGVLYELGEGQFEKLRSSEIGYSVREVSVTLANGQRHHAKTFVANPDQIIDNDRPCESYLAIIEKGSRESGLTGPYIQQLLAKGRGR